MSGDKEKLFDLLNIDTTAEADKWVEGYIMGAMQNVVPDIGPPQTCLALFQAIVAVAAHTGADPEMFQRQLTNQCAQVASMIRKIRLAQAGERQLIDRIGKTSTTEH